jgi:hypothetical protein
MSYSYPEIRQFRGRYAQRNSFEVPDGALEVAENVTVGRDFIIAKRRGFYDYFVPVTGTLKGLVKYEDRVVSLYGTKVSYYTDTGVSPNETGAETNLTAETGVTWSITGTRIPRVMAANENIYVTTDSGVLKLTAYNSLIQFVGSPSGQDASAQFVPGVPSSWFEADKVVGYRVVFGRKDANDNLILGAPGDVATLTNPKITASYTSSGAGPWTVTVITSLNHGLLTGQYLVLSDAVDANANGTFVITVTTPTAFTYSVTSGDPTSGTIKYARAEAVLLEVSVPEECASTTQGWFAQIYRSGQYDIAGAVFGDYRLATQRTLTAAEISSNILFYQDTMPSLLLGAELYTNENTQEGEFQANARPPKANDIALFKNYAFYADVTTRAFLELNVVDATVITAGDQFLIRIIDGATFEETYVAREGVANTLAYSNVIAGTGTLTVTYTGHGFSNGDVIYVSNFTGGSYANQSGVVSGVAGANFNVTLTGSGTPTALWFEGVTNGTNPIFKLDKTSTSVAVQLAQTAQGLVKAISRRNGGLCYGRYLSDFTEVPGQFAIFARNFPSSIAVRVSSAGAGAGFEPVLAVTYGDVVSNSTTDQHNLYISKVSEPEAVPTIQFLPVGSENEPIQRIAALRDSLIIIKKDGVFRLSGDDPNNFVVTILDSTVLCVAPDSVAVVNNQVAMLSNVGVVMISETAVNIVSRKIEEDIRPILGRSETLAHGLSYESERLYLLTCSRPNDATLSVCHIYNTLTDEWTTWDKLFVAGVVGPSDTLFLVDLFNSILKERNKQTRLDFSDQNYPTTVLSVGSDLKSVIISMSTASPEPGDILVLNNTINRITTTPVLTAPNTYLCVLLNQTTLEAGNQPILYGRIRSMIRTAPFHAGMVGRSKQYAQTQLHFRSDQASRLVLYFIGDTILGSTEIEWKGLWQNAGWGYFPWAFDYFAQAYGIDLPIGTGPSPICRIYVPIQQQRSTYMQTVIEHVEAGESINLQAQSWTIRAYAERVSR